MNENKSMTPVLSISIPNCGKMLDFRTLFRESIIDKFAQRDLAVGSIYKEANVIGLFALLPFIFIHC